MYELIGEVPKSFPVLGFFTAFIYIYICVGVRVCVNVNVMYEGFHVLDYYCQYTTEEGHQRVLKALAVYTFMFYWIKVSHLRFSFVFHIY